MVRRALSVQKKLVFKEFARKKTKLEQESDLYKEKSRRNLE